MIIYFYQVKNDLYKNICIKVEELYLEDKDRKITILAANQQMIQDIDLKLWTFKRLSFIPHYNIEEDPIDKHFGVCVTKSISCLNGLSNVILSFPSQQLNHLNESLIDKLFIFFRSAEEIDYARILYKNFKDRGYDLHHHKLS